jgi:gliding motility-associated-like protein
MKNLIKSKLFFFFVFAGAGTTLAQTVNTGEFAVSPGTNVNFVSDFNNTATGDFLNDGAIYIYANFNNDGLVTFTPTKEGIAHFEGFLPQTISGNVKSEFKHVLFNNANKQPAFQLFCAISVAGNVDFFKGIVKCDNFKGLIIFEKDATDTNVSNQSHVDGYVLKNGGSEFQSPIGDGGYFRFAKISETNVQANSYLVKYFYTDSDLLFPHSNKQGFIDQIDNTEYWTADRINGSSKVMITLSWDETTTPSFIRNNIEPNSETISIVRWDEKQKKWVNEGGIVDFDAKTVTSFSDVSGFGVFTLASVKGIVEPVGNVVVYNAISPNGDGINDFFLIDGITLYPKNKVEIYNRLGIKVFETKDYNSSGNVFNGYLDTNTRISKQEKLPSDTYFYVIEYEYESNGKPTRTIRKAGYLYVKND